MRNSPNRLLLVINIFLICAPALADSPMQDAYKALRLLDAATEAGISYQSFRDEWAKTNGAVTIALEDTKPGPSTKQLQAAKDAYNDLSALWNCAVQGHFIQTALQFCFDQGFRGRNPAVMSAFQERLVEEPIDNQLFVKAVVPLLMATASAQVKTLGEVLKSEKN